MNGGQRSIPTTRAPRIMVDIGFFKPFNDDYDHLRGDDWLKLIVTRSLLEISSVLRIVPRSWRAADRVSSKGRHNRLRPTTRPRHKRNAGQQQQ